MPRRAIPRKERLRKQKQHQQDYTFRQRQAAAAAAGAAAAAAPAAVTESLAGLSLTANQETAGEVLAVRVGEESGDGASAPTASAATDGFPHPPSRAPAACQHSRYPLRTRATAVESREVASPEGRTTATLSLHSGEDDRDSDFTADTAAPVTIDDGVHPSEPARLSPHDLAARQLRVSWDPFCSHGTARPPLSFASLPPRGVSRRMLIIFHP